MLLQTDQILKKLVSFTEMLDNPKQLESKFLVNFSEIRRREKIYVQKFFLSKSEDEAIPGKCGDSPLSLKEKNIPKKKSSRYLQDFFSEAANDASSSLVSARSQG